MTADPVKTVNVSETRSGSVHPEPKSGSSLVTRVVLLISLAGLFAVMIGVIWILPGQVNKTSVSVSEAPIVQAAPSPPTEMQTRLAKEKRKAERALGGFLQRQVALEGQEVATWGGAEYEEVLLTLAAADAAFANGGFELANTKYSAASAMLNDLEASKSERLEQALAEAAVALGNYDAERAKHHYEIALALEPENKEALMGAQRAVNVAQLATWLTQARDLEQLGDWLAARELYKQAAALDPQSTEAQEGLARVNAEIDAQRFRTLMSDALAATEAGRFDVARDALAAAVKLKPDSPDVRDAQQRLQLALQQHRISAHRELAQTLVQSERWREAAQEYGAVLAIDPQAQFAVQGLAYSKRLVKLHDQLDQYILEPGRLHSAEPRANARLLLDALQAMQEKGPRLIKKQQQLTGILELAETPLTVLLQSDEMTIVRIDRVGDLGRFKESAVTLLPGNYIVRGSRVGYRDIRLQLAVEPGASTLPLVVQCEEKI